MAILKKSNTLFMLTVVSFCLFSSSCSRSENDNNTSPIHVDSVYGKIEYTDSLNLSQPRFGLAAASLGNKVYFAGGSLYSHSVSTIDIYDVTTNKWTIANLSEPRAALVGVAVAGKVLFAGGFAVESYSKTVDIYDTLTNTWSTASLSEGRMSLRAVVVGNKVLFAGGQKATYVFSDVVDIYDASTNVWSTAHLSLNRIYMAAQAIGNKAIFAGGRYWNQQPEPFPTTRIDIYDGSSNSWTTSELSTSRYSMGEGVASGKMMLLGGYGDTTLVEIFDPASNTWTTTHLPQGMAEGQSVSNGNFILYTGGFSLKRGALGGGYAYNMLTDQWTAFPTLGLRNVGIGVSIGNKIFIAGGTSNTSYLSTVDVFTLSK